MGAPGTSTDEVPDGPLVGAIERLGEIAGRAISWLTLACVLVCFAVVVLRYVFGIGFVFLQELYVWLHAIVFTGGAAYALKHDTHVRVDVFYARFSDRTKAWVNLAGATLMVLPWMALIAWLAWPWVRASWATRESSAMSDGMPALYLLKSMLLIMAALLSLQAVALAARSINVLRRG
jgi:TRAP-type mannitol/chloroaromatic compound transport system permease small subunit